VGSSLDDCKSEQHNIDSLLFIAVNLVDKDKLDILDELRSSVNVEKADMERRLQQVEEEVKAKEEQLRMNISQINTLLMEKVDLQSDSIGQKNDALQREKDMVALRASMAAGGSSSSSSEEARELLASKEAELQTSQEKLQKARTFIRQQDKMIRDADTKTSVTPEEVLKKMKKVEQENALLRQEQKLMTSAWYDVNNRLNRELMMTGTFRKNGSNRAQTKAGANLTASKPKSWLQQQRNELAGGIPLSRRQ
jgi:protein HOOK3